MSWGEVVVEKSRAAARDGRQSEFTVGGRLVDEIEPGLIGDVGKPWGSGGCAAVRRPAVAAGHAKHGQDKRQENCRGKTCRQKDKQSGKKGPAEKTDRPLPGGSGRSGLVAYVAKSQPLLLLLGHKVRVLGQRLNLSGDPESPARVRCGDAVR